MLLLLLPSCRDTCDEIVYRTISSKLNTTARIMDDQSRQLEASGATPPGGRGALRSSQPLPRGQTQLNFAPVRQVKLDAFPPPPSPIWGY